MELHFEISDKLAELIRSYFYKVHGKNLVLGKGPWEISRLMGIMVANVLQSAPEMADEIETNKFGGWVKPTLQEITVDGSRMLVKPIRPGVSE